MDTADSGVSSRTRHSHFLKDFKFELLVLSTLIKAQTVVRENCLAEWRACCSLLSSIIAHPFSLINRPQTESYSRVGTSG
jgi:hypothetical protein